ncbi:transcription antitermination regulator [Pokkaliibacter plantistimulans]|uniref:Transcription antitermination regulator n=1 Tax=Proteobacteria bacterium 228 TaxID=2083153 RepID=A0A2S5KWJ9_9PROT|nr:nitrate regulatory protein [Pokkaliibacter plantistimulans]PPC79093.1 transcription antitermination regulator [Pokkaliibacter plantistimulans]
MAERNMPAALRFMLAARRCDLQGLEELVHTCKLVSNIAQLVHALQKERGYSNIYLGRNATHYRTELDQFSEEGDALERIVRNGFELMDLDAVGSAERGRLYIRIAHVFYSLESLGSLRRRIRDHQISARDATAAFTQLIGGLLAVVFEAADSAADPEITRSLVALFNFMQGKELAGQERATGVAGFAHGYFDDEHKQRMQSLIDNQERSFEVFLRYASDDAKARWQVICTNEVQAQTEGFRKIAANTHPAASVDTGLCEFWFEMQTQRINAMQALEQYLTQQLQEQCKNSIREIRDEVSSHRRLLGQLAEQHLPLEQARLFNVQDGDITPQPQDVMPTQVSRSILDLLQLQTRQLQQANDELTEARASLNERKLIDRAKHLLMSESGLSENEAHAKMQRSAMDGGVRMVDVAQRLIAAAERVKSGARTARA